MNKKLFGLIFPFIWVVTQSCLCGAREHAPIPSLVHSAQFSPDGKRLVTGSSDAARVWDAQTGKPLTEPMKHDGGVHSAQLSPDGKRIVTASSDNTARVWDAQTGKPLTEPMKHRHDVSHHAAKMRVREGDQSAPMCFLLGSISQSSFPRCG